MKNKVKFGVISGLLIVMIMIGIYTGLVWTGQQPIPGFVVRWILDWERSKNDNVPLSMNDSIFLDEFTLQVANDLLEAMKGADEGVLDGYVFNDVGTAHKVFMALGIEILNGRTCTSEIQYADGGGYKLCWNKGNEIIAQHQAASEFVNIIWSGIEETVNSFGSEQEKVAFMAEHIKNNIITGYDSSLNNGTIYDVYVSGTATGVCNAFATLLDRLCEKAGIECYVILGYQKDVCHAWNKVVFSDGSIHHYDLTYYVSSRDMTFMDMSDETYRYWNYTPVQFNSEKGYGMGCYKLQ